MIFNEGRPGLLTERGVVDVSALVRPLGGHDAMVAHERKIRAGRPDAVCDEECPHAEARTLWAEALEVFGERAQKLTFLREHAAAASERTEGRARDRRVAAEGRAVRVAGAARARFERLPDSVREPDRSYAAADR